MRPRRPAKPFMKRTNVNKNFKSVSPRKRLFRFALYGFASCAFGCLPFALSATTANVSIVNFAFSPPSVKINVNDSVNWTWAGSPHSTTSDMGLWESGVRGTGAIFTHTFTSASWCLRVAYQPPVPKSREDSEMAVTRADKEDELQQLEAAFRGSESAILVDYKGMNVPQVTELRRQLRTAKAKYRVVKNTIARRALKGTSFAPLDQFFQGTTSLGSVANSPYSVTVRDLAAGNYTFSAVAADNAGTKVTNSVMMRVVSPEPTTLTAAQICVITASVL